MFCHLVTVNVSRGLRWKNNSLLCLSFICATFNLRIGNVAYYLLPYSYKFMPFAKLYGDGTFKFMVLSLNGWMYTNERKSKWSIVYCVQSPHLPENVPIRTISHGANFKPTHYFLLKSVHISSLHSPFQSWEAMGILVIHMVLNMVYIYVSSTT